MFVAVEVCRVEDGGAEVHIVCVLGRQRLRGCCHGVVICDGCGYDLDGRGYLREDGEGVEAEDAEG